MNSSGPASTRLRELLADYDQAVSYTELLWRDLTDDEVRWRPHEQASAIGWHLGHQAAVTHFLVRNLTAAEPSPDPGLDQLMDSATPEPERGELPDIERLTAYRTAVGQRLRERMGAIGDGRVGASTQLAVIADTLLTAVIDHEYQHDKWIGEVREHLGHNLPPRPSSPQLRVVDGYLLRDPSR